MVARNESRDWLPLAASHNLMYARNLCERQFVGQLGGLACLLTPLPRKELVSWHGWPVSLAIIVLAATLLLHADFW